MTVRIPAVLALIALAAALPAAAHAQLGGMEGGDGPIIVDAETLDVFNEEGRVIYEGRVDAAQDETQIRTDRLELYFEKSGETGGGAAGVGSGMGDLQRAIAIGSVYYVTPEMMASGDRAVYDFPADTVTLTGDVVVKQGCDVLTGREIVMNLTTGNAQVRAGADGQAGAAAPGRVRTVIYPSGEAPQENCE